MSTTFPTPAETTPRSAYVAWAVLVPALVLAALVLGAVAVQSAGATSLIAAVGVIAALTGVAVHDGRARSGPAPTPGSRTAPSLPPVLPGDPEPESADPWALRLRELSVVTDDAVHRAMAAGHIGLARELFDRSIDEASSLIDDGRRNPGTTRS